MTMRWRSPSGAQTAESSSSSALNPSAENALEGKEKENNQQYQHSQQQSPFGGDSQSTTASSSASCPILDDEPDTATSSSQMIEEEEMANGISKNIPQTASSSTPDTILVSAADPSSGDPPYEASSSSISANEHKISEFPLNKESAVANHLPMTSSSSAATADEDESDLQEIPWRPQATQSTCEFTHTITNYSQKRDSGCKKAEYSATTIDEFGNRWRLIVYVNGNGRASNHHLSLFLQVADADDLPFGWKKAVSYVLTLEHPSGPNLSYAKRNPDKTFKLCPKAIDWGWSQFITSDRIQQEGFVQNDALVVRASVTVKSSSVCIDLEDAELYLKCAVEEGKPEAVQLCLEQGASVNCQFKDDLYTPLHTACSSSTAEDVAAAAAAIASDEAPPPTSNNNHHNPGSMKVLNLLLEKGADGNACNKWRETPLLIAANNGHRAAVEALLKHGADPSLCSEAGWSALTFAAHKGYDDIVALLLRAGAPVNCRVTEDSSTPLHKACAGSKPGHLTAVKLLLEHDADVHALNKWRETPLLTAANHGQAGAVEALLRAGADPCKCTDTGWSPLSIAAYKGHDDVVRLLLEEGAPTEEADPTLSALLQAATKGLPGTVELLLKHGADHTVTTKKGDTALSILVEQNLIDAAVEMVTAYKASVPRCSRDRKKVQRARLLINLRVKQQQKEGKLIVSDDDETDEEIQETKTALELEPVEKSNPNTKKKKITAEEQAKLAEEALLMELAEEDAKRSKEAQEANKKSAKKRKKKERERQQKKEQEEKRLAEEREKERKDREAREAKERAEKKRREEEEKKRQQQMREQQRKEQQMREQQRKEQQLKEQQQREQLLKEQQRLKVQQQKEQQKEQQNSTKNASPAATEKKGKATKAKATKKQPVGLAPVSANASNKQETANKGVVGLAPKIAASAKPVAKSASQAVSRPATSTGKNRGWETKQPTVEKKKSFAKPTNGHTDIGSSNLSVSTSSSGSPKFSTPGRNEKTVGSEYFPQPASSPFAQQAAGEITSMLNPNPASAPQQAFTHTDPLLNGLSTPPFPAVEVPAVALFRRDKVSELLQRCALARTSNDPLSVVSESTIRKVLYRWMVRAAHESSPLVDFIIPSWHDFEQLTTFFQRQFISESRKGVNQSAPGSAMLSMESLREAGSAMALLCHSLAKDIADFCRRVDEQLPRDWADSTIGMNASMQNGAASMVYLTWANRSQVSLPVVTFTKLRERYTGPQSRLLSALFSAKIRYDTKDLLVDDDSADVCLPPDTQSVLSLQLSVSAEIWSDPFSAQGGSIFWGQFSDVDSLFGGLAPFSKENGGEDLLIRHGGSVSVVPPQDNMVSSRYIHRMVDILDQTERDRIPVSFVVFCRAECFLDWNNSPSLNDLFMLDPRLRDRSMYIMKVEQLSAGQHTFFNESTGKVETSASGSLFVLLQNEGGRSHYPMNDATFVDIIRSLGGNVSRSQEPKLLTPMSFSAPEFVPSQDPHSYSAGYFDSHPSNPVSPIRQHSLPTDYSQHQQTPLEFGAIGGTTISNAFSAAPASGGRRARGRLFDLVDDGEEDQLNDVDVVSGMLGNLNVDLFHTSSGGDPVVDIEAISLMGIGGPPPSGGLQPRNSRGRFG